MKKPTTDKRIAALNLTRSVHRTLTVARAMVLAMGGNKSFPAPDPPLAAISTAADDLEAAQARVDQRVKGASDDRDAKQAALVKLLHEEKAYVQKVADAGDPAHAADVIQSAAIAVKHVPARRTRAFTAKPGPTPGSAALAAPSPGRRSSYEWEYSADGGKTWVAAPPSVQSRTIVTGLQPDTAYAFRYRTVTKAGPSLWSDPVTLLVR